MLSWYLKWLSTVHWNNYVTLLFENAITNCHIKYYSTIPCYILINIIVNFYFPISFLLSSFASIKYPSTLFFWLLMRRGGCLHFFLYMIVFFLPRPSHPCTYHLNCLHTSLQQCCTIRVKRSVNKPERPINDYLAFSHFCWKEKCFQIRTCWTEKKPHGGPVCAICDDPSRKPS